MNATMTLAPNNYKSLVAQKKLLELSRFKKKIVAFSGGKDSLDLVLTLLEMGVPKDEIELWHHLIDGAPGSPRRFDWPITESYVNAVGNALGIAVRFSWKDGGFERELFRKDAMTAGVYYQDGSGVVRYLPPASPGSYCDECRVYYEGKETHCLQCNEPRRGFSTRWKYPLKTSDLNKRWCSAYLKIDVCRRVLKNDPRFDTGCVLVLTGERREESTARAAYCEVVEYNSTKTRYIQQWRGVIDHNEDHVWDIISRWRIKPHPCYYLGFSRCSCMCCIFGDKNQWASIREISPERVKWHADNEKRFGLTITKGLSVNDQADRGTSFLTDAPPWLVDLALSDDYPYDEVFVPEDQEWQLPAGAYKKQCGPT